MGPLVMEQYLSLVKECTLGVHSPWRYTVFTSCKRMHIGSPFNMEVYLLDTLVNDSDLAQITMDFGSPWKSLHFLLSRRDMGWGSMLGMGMWEGNRSGTGI